LRGERTGIRYALGTRVQVQVSRVDLDGRRIDFRLVTGEDDLLLRAMRDKTGAAGDGEASTGRGGKARRNGPSEAASKPRPASAADALVHEVKASVKRAASKKSARGNARPSAGKVRKGRR
ncbi:MAG: ribonuclease R, partial [Hydrogenophaga sp.]|nr:ribonuclease R [Hydrogenophaga sp.]